MRLIYTLVGCYDKYNILYKKYFHIILSLYVQLHVQVTVATCKTIFYTFITLVYKVYR
jgi:hypothetical protein